MIVASFAPYAVPPLRYVERFRAGTFAAVDAWLCFLWRAECARIDEKDELGSPTLPAEATTLAEEMRAHGPALWDHVRATFAQYYESGPGVEEHFDAEHRFWALWRLRDRMDEADLQPWIRPDQPLLLAPPLVTVAAEARLDLWHASMDAPLAERSEFDLNDLLSRAQSLHSRVMEEARQYAELRRARTRRLLAAAKQRAKVFL